MHRRHLIAAPLVLLLALGASACGDDDDTSATTTAGGGTEVPEAVAVTAVDYGYEGLPDEIAVGQPIALTNDSDAELHELVAFPLADDEDRSAEELVALPQDELMALLAGEPATVIIAPPGEEGFPVVGDGSLPEAGRYLVLCAIPTGADPEEYLAAAQESTGGPPDVEGGPPHFTAGMYGEIEAV